jgi:hypothetical protein
MTSSDQGRAAVYAAETAAFDGTDLEDVRPHDVVASLIGSVTGGQWWPGPSVVVVPARRGTLSSATHGPLIEHSTGVVMIRLVESQATIATAAHELAHALAGVVHGHDDMYRRAYLDVIDEITNLDAAHRRGDLHVRQLAEAFADAGLTVGERTWPPPPGTASGHVIAL